MPNIKLQFKFPPGIKLDHCRIYDGDLNELIACAGAVGEHSNYNLYNRICMKMGLVVPLGFSKRVRNKSKICLKVVKSKISCTR